MSTAENLIKIKAHLKNVKIHIIHYCHADYAWTHPRKWHIERYEQIICEVLDVINTNDDYYWMADNIYPILQPCLSKDFNRFDEFWQRVREGRIEITNGIMTLIRPTMTGNETFIRNIVLGNEYLKTILPDFQTDIFHNVDVSIGHSQLPQVLTLGGYKFYRGWRPQGAMDAKGIPRQFNWVGIDGTSIICSRGTYAGFWQADYMTKENFSDSDGSLIEFYNTEIKDILDHSLLDHIWVPFGMDDTRPMRDVKDNPVNFDSFMEYFNKTTGAVAAHSKAKTYFTGLAESELPVYKGALDPTDVGYNISSKGDKGLWHLRILLDRLLVMGESICTMAAMEGKTYPGESFKELWNNLLLICSHGMEFVFADDYQNIYNLAIFSVSTAKKMINDAKVFISGQTQASNNPGYNLFNTLNWERHDTILLPLDKNKSNSLEVKDCFGKVLPHQLVFLDSNYTNSASYVLVEASVPSLGFTTIGLNFDHTFYTRIIHPPENNSLTPVEIDTGGISVLFEQGYIKGINGITDLSKSDLYLSKIRFTELVQTPDDAWLYNNNRGDVHEMIVKEWVWEEFGPLRWKYVVTGTVEKYSFTQEITLYKDKSNIDFYLQLDCSKKGSGFFSAVFPADCDTEFMADIPFGIEKRDIVNEPYGVVTDISIDNLERLWDGLFYAKSWINYSIDSFDITLFGTNCPRYYWYNYDDKSVSIVLNRNYILSDCTDWMKDTHPWNENPGIISFSYSAIIQSKPQYGGFVCTIKKAKEMQNPIEVIQAGDRYIKQSDFSTKSFFDIKSASSVISAMYSDKGKIILRLYNASDKPDQVEISCCKKILSYQITDFLLNELPEKTPFFVNNNCILLDTAPWEILTIVLDILQ